MEAQSSPKFAFFVFMMWFATFASILLKLG